MKPELWFIAAICRTCGLDGSSSFGLLPDTPEDTRMRLPAARK